MVGGDAFVLWIRERSPDGNGHAPGPGQLLGSRPGSGRPVSKPRSGRCSLAHLPLFSSTGPEPTPGLGREGRGLPSWVTKLSLIRATYWTLNQCLSSQKAVLVGTAVTWDAAARGSVTGTAVYRILQALQPVSLGVRLKPSPLALDCFPADHRGFEAEPQDVPSAAALPLSVAFALT